MSIKCNPEMLESRFKSQYIAGFLAARAAHDYDRNCQEGWVDQSQPIEDAACLADEAWDQLKEAGMVAK